MEAQRINVSGAVPEWNGDVEYCVRFWTHPVIAQRIWAVDDWSIADARDAQEVIEWASSKAGQLPVEVFVFAIDHSMSAGGSFDEKPVMIRLYGVPGEGPSTVETIEFETV